MLKFIFLLFTLILFFSVSAFTDQHIIWNHPNQKQSFAMQQDLRIFYKLNPNFKMLFETEVKELITVDNTNDWWETNKKEIPEVLSFRLGGLYRIHPNLKIGLYYQLYNRRNFWTGNLNSEHAPILEFKPRFKLARTWVFELRLRNEFNYYSGSEQNRGNPLWYTIKIRPKLSYFLVDEIKLKLIAFVSYEAYIPVTYSMEHLEHWAYLGLTIPLNKTISLSPYYSMRYLGNANGSLTTSMTHTLGTGIILDF